MPFPKVETRFVSSPWGLLVKPGLLEVCVFLTSTFQGQLFRHRFASAGSYAPTTRCLPAQAPEVRDYSLPSFQNHAS
jgi:hypothetical protein